MILLVMEAVMAAADVAVGGIDIYAFNTESFLASPCNQEVSLLRIFT